MKVLVCVSNVPDTTTKIRFNADASAFDANGVQWIINPWDELALTRAVDLKEGGKGIDQISVISVGSAQVEPTLRKALAIGADAAIRIDANPGDAFHTASLMAAAVKDMGFDLIMAGVESSDYNGGLVGGMLAELLGVPSVAAISGLDLNAGQVTVRREVEGGSEQLAVELPALLVVQKGIAKEPRIPAMRGIMLSRTKPLQVLTPDADSPVTRWTKFRQPEVRSACKMVDAENIDELVRLLHEEAKVI
jgi:electron transfer flavoprotein beta subunit